MFSFLKPSRHLERLSGFPHVKQSLTNLLQSGPFNCDPTQLSSVMSESDIYDFIPLTTRNNPVASLEYTTLDAKSSTNKSSSNNVLEASAVVLALMQFLTILGLSKLKSAFFA